MELLLSMSLHWSSASYWPQMKVTLFLKSISLVLVLGLILGLDTVPVHSSPVQVHRDTHQELFYCNFMNIKTIYTIRDLLNCMNELAIKTNNQRYSRSINEKFQYRRPNLNHHSLYPKKHPGYYEYPPALPPGYPSSSDSSFTGGILGINLADALSSISQYDDLKCVPRIICEVATGVIPGNSMYKQSYTSIGVDALINFLKVTTVDDTSPLLNFGKSVLMGYANRGNPEICYRQYPKCPRNPDQIVNYLNNHNGGFFRFFNNNKSGTKYRFAVADETLKFTDDFVSNRRDTGKIKFDTTTPKIQSKILNNYDREENNKKIIFPEDGHRHFNRLIKSFDYGFENHRVTQDDTPPFFPQDRMDQKIPDQSYFLNHRQSSNEQENFYNKSKIPEAKLYLLDNISNQIHQTFTFPDGQNVMIDTGFSKLFNDGYKKMLKRGLIVNDLPQSINFEGLSVINLLELYTEVDISSYIQVVHPCNMICHDSRGTAVQFNQIVNSRGTLSTIMTPERPIIDLSQSLPCEVICMHRNGDTQQLSTTMDKVLRLIHNHRGKHEVDKMTNRFKRVPSGNKLIKPRFVGDTYRRTGGKSSLQYENSPQIPEMSMPMGSPFALPPQNSASFGGATYSNENSWQNQFLNNEDSQAISVLSNENQDSLEGVVMGENPLAVGVTIPSRSSMSSSIESDIPIPATVIMCGGSVFFIPVDSQRTPKCGSKVDTLDTAQTQQILYQPRNQWGNYTNFFAIYENITDSIDIMNETDTQRPIDDVTIPIEHPKPPTTVPIIDIPTTQPLITSIPIQPDVFDYQQSTSCLSGESWDSIDQQCVPVKYHKDAEYDYPSVSGYDWKSVPVQKRDEERQKIVIMTPDANMYIKSV